MDVENKNQDQTTREDYFLFHYDEEEEEDEEEETPNIEGEVNELQKEEDFLFNRQEDPEQETKIKEESVSQLLEELSGGEGNPYSDQGEFSLSRSKAALVKKLLRNIQENNEKLLRIFEDADEKEEISLSKESAENENKEEEEETENIIEGVFDGENMIGPDGRQYSVPLNYASKSKLVEGDILKLTITEKGNFKYKQIYPIQRARIVGELKKGTDGNYYVVKNGQKWRVLSAGVTFFKGNPGDEVALLIPAEGDSKWGAIENIIKK